MSSVSRSAATSQYIMGCNPSQMHMQIRPCHCGNTQGMPGTVEALAKCAKDAVFSTSPGALTDREDARECAPRLRRNCQDVLGSKDALQDVEQSF